MKKTNGFQRLLLSYLPVFFLIVATLLFLAYLSLNEMSTRSAMKANTLLSHTISQTIDGVLRGVDEMISGELRDNEKLTQFFADIPASERRQVDYEAAAALGAIIRKQPLVHSIYLYRTKDATVLTPSSISGLNAFGDKEFIGSRISSLRPFHWENKRFYQESPGFGGADVVSLVRIADLSDRSLLVVHVSTAKLSEMIGSMSESKLNFVELIDESGKLIASKASTGPSGQEGAVPDSGKELAHIRSDYTGWSVRVGIYKSSILDWVSSLFYVWITLGFIVVALGAVWFVLVTRRHYRPILTWASRIEAYARLKSRKLQLDERKDEFKYIENAIDQLLDEHSMLQVKDEENIVYRRRHVFLHLLEGEGGMGDKLQNMELLGLSGDDSTCMTVMLFEIDQFQEFTAKYNRRDQQLLKQVIGNVLREIAGDMRLALYGEWVNPHRFAVLLQLAGKEGAEETAVSLSDKLREWIGDNMSFTVTAGIGGVYPELARLPESFRLASRLLGYKSSLGANRIIVEADTQVPHGETFKQLEEIRLLCQSFRAGDPAWEERLHSFYRSIRNSLFTRDDLYNVFTMLTVHLHREMMELPAEFQDIWNSSAALRIDRIMERHETLDAIYGELDALLVEAFEEMRRLREKKSSHHMLQNIKQYIAEQYGNPELSLASVSEQFGYNASYLSRIFKEEFGVKFIDYVTQIRIEKATRLLKETEDAVQHVAEEVGYTNALSFIRAFKKQTGTTPGSYRKELPETI
ncbi:helix-turn-helix domain-containing protein [Paenibacillus hodogayensis]|uniref:Helix-turn-helix domain-containing protein n=1 Tax=Paenibacillus hodogayensis TaxID=279208 RepID=A0ABV5W3W0_9BACL